MARGGILQGAAKAEHTYIADVSRDSIINGLSIHMLLYRFRLVFGRQIKMVRGADVS